jgi:lipopolysaccharide assembly protein A
VKVVAWLLKAAVFFAVFAFALNNQAVVRLNFFFGTHWDAPLVLVLLAVMVLGVVLGVLIMIPVWLSAKKRATPRHIESPAPHGL